MPLERGWKPVTENEMEVIRIIRESKDPVKAMYFALNTLTRLVAGESPDSIMASYGIEWEGTK